MEVKRGRTAASARDSRAVRATLAVALVSALASCGGRSISGAPDSGELDGGRDGSEDAGGCDDSLCPFDHPDCCGRCLDSVDQCSSVAPFCCGEDKFCYRVPIDYPEQSDDRCYERPLESSIVGIDCSANGNLTSELCPAGHPYCCSTEEGDVCIDHLLVGWHCDPDR